MATLHKIQRSISQSEVVRHTFVWFLLWCFLLVGALEAGWPFWFSVATQTPYWILYMITFYGLLYQACPAWHSNRAQFLLLSTAVFGLFLVGYVFLDHTIPEYVFDGEEQPTYPLWSHIIDGICVFTFIEIPALGLYFQKYNIAKIEANSQREIDLIRVEERLVRQELNFYKSEFNIHITFNTLSHIYAKVMDDPELANPVLILSDILRYNLKVQAHQEVAMEQELSYLESFIGIHRVLFPRLRVDFSVEGELKNVRILPRILISFVENAIKHGDKSNVDYPIKVILRIDDCIRFSVENKKRQRNYVSKTSTKTGINNVQKTLAAFYPDRYRLTIDQDDETYRVYLEIDGLHLTSRMEGVLAVVHP